MAKQIDEAVDTAKHAIEAGLLGSGKVTVTLSGHANPNFEHRSGYADNSITIYLQQAPN